MGLEPYEFLTNSSRNHSFSGVLRSMPHGATANAFIGITATLLIGCTMVGNVLVICAVFIVRKLRHPSNFLLVSLAASDFCVGLVVMPFACLYHVFGEWIFGEIFCDFWTSADVLLCTASILNLCAISVDRYWAISHPLTYAPRRTTKRVMLYILIVWILAFLISVVPLVAFHKPLVPGNKECAVDDSLPFQIYATLGAFYIPVLIMVILNFKIFSAARQLVKREHRTSTSDMTTQSASEEATLSNCTDSLDELANERSRWCIPRRSSSGQRLSRKSLLAQICDHLSGQQRNPSTSSVRSNIKIPSGLMQRENKAAKTLSIIMGAFITCWLPFFLLALIKPICGKYCAIPQWLDAIVLWLGYLNSTINPVLYATFNRDFRIPFREILCCRCRTLQMVLRHEIYAEIYGDAPAGTGEQVYRMPGNGLYRSSRSSCSFGHPRASFSRQMVSPNKELTPF